MRTSVFMISYKPCWVNQLPGQINGIYKRSLWMVIGSFALNASAYRNGQSTVALVLCLLKVINDDS